MAETNTQALTPTAQFHQAFQKMESQFSLALPKHMPVERFMRVVLTAVNSNPELLQADRQSLFESAMKAAQDGLLPDGREGALVIYNTKVSKRGEADRWIKKVQWMPMVAGIMKKARNSGEIALITAGCVWGGDKFRYWIDDEGEHIFYEPSDKQDRSVFVKAFAMAKLKDGTVYALPMSPSDVDKVRAASKAKDGPAWNNWYDQMAQKAAIRRLAKRLPMSSDLDDLIRRDDELYDFSGKNDPERVAFQPVRNPLSDEEPKAIEHDAGEDEQSEMRGAEAELEEYDLAITLDGKVLKAPDGAIAGGMAIVDRRFDGKDAYFDHADQWHEACADNGFFHTIEKGTLVEASPKTNKGTKERGGAAQEAAESDGDEGGADAPEAGKDAPAASGGPAKARSEPKADPKPADKPVYKDGAGFLEWLKAELAACKTKAAVQDLWGACRQDRADLCSADQIEAAADLKNAAIERVNKAKR